MTEQRISPRAAKLASKVAELAKGELAPDEAVLMAVRVLLKGTVGATAAGAIGGVAGVLVSAKITESGGKEAEMVGFPTDPQQALGLTHQSLVVVSRSQLSGKPKAFRALIPLEAITDIAFERGKMGDGLTFTMQDGSEFSYVCVKVDPGEEFARAVKERIQAG